MASFAMTEAFSDYIAELIKNHRTSNSMESDLLILKEALKIGSVSHIALRVVAQLSENKADLKALLNGSKIVFDKTDFSPSKNLQNIDPNYLENRRAYLKLKQEEREYNKMVHGSEM